MTSSKVSEAHLSGRVLYGDDLAEPDISNWYADEERGYFDLVRDEYGSSSEALNYRYEYDGLNAYHVIDRLRATRRFHTCLALGCATGDDVRPLAPIVEQFVCVEPAESWWRTEIGGRPARYIKPSLTGVLDLASADVDLATSFGVLHHIPNVTAVVTEIARVMKPGGLFIVREPISWMGDWRRKRPGLTRHERGLPVGWFEGMAKRAGFSIEQRRFCMLPGAAAVAAKLGLNYPYSSRALAALDHWACTALSFNVHYRRDAIWKKAGPAAAFYYDDPSTTAAQELRSDAAIPVTPDQTANIEGTLYLNIPSQECLVVLHTGSYQGLGDAWSRAYGEALAESGREPLDAAPFELYLNECGKVPEAELLTEICIPLKPATVPSGA